MVVLEAEATLAVTETFVDDVASSVLAPSLRVTTGTISTLAQHLLFAFKSKNLGLSSSPLLLRERRGEDEEELILF